MPIVKQEELDELIAANVRAARARLRWRQQDLADELGWSRPTISDVEAGTRRITLADAFALCQALEIELPQLVAGVDPDVLRAVGIERRSPDR